MTPEMLAALHARAFPDSRGWSPSEIAAFLERPGVFLTTGANGFAIGRAVLDEAELVTICIDPAGQGRGDGQRLLKRFEAAAAARGARSVFLEVAEDNVPARALYARAAYVETGRRPGYYVRVSGPAADAILMRGDIAGA